MKDRHYWKKYNKFRKLVNNWYMPEDWKDRAAKRRATTPKPCSCSGCGNPRNSGWEEPRTRQEIKNDLYYQHWKDEY